VTCRNSEWLKPSNPISIGPDLGLQHLPGLDLGRPLRRHFPLQADLLADFRTCFLKHAKWAGRGPESCPAAISAGVSVHRTRQIHKCCGAGVGSGPRAEPLAGGLIGPVSAWAAAGKVCGFCWARIARRCLMGRSKSADGGGLPHRLAKDKWPGAAFFPSSGFVTWRASAVVPSGIFRWPSSGDQWLRPIRRLRRKCGPAGGKKPGAAKRPPDPLAVVWAPRWGPAGGSRNPGRYPPGHPSATLGQLQFEGLTGVPRSTVCPLCPWRKQLCSHSWRRDQVKACAMEWHCLPKADPPKADH